MLALTDISASYTMLPLCPPACCEADDNPPDTGRSCPLVPPLPTAWLPVCPPAGTIGWCCAALLLVACEVAALLLLLLWLGCLACWAAPEMLESSLQTPSLVSWLWVGCSLEGGGGAAVVVVWESRPRRRSSSRSFSRSDERRVGGARKAFRPGPV